MGWAARPVQLARPGYRTLLLGLKQARDYSFHIEATRDGQTCVSPSHALPTTGRLASSPPVTVSVSRPDAREPRFIVASSGTGVPELAFIIDADGDIVWSAEARSTRRARSWTTRAITSG